MKQIEVEVIKEWNKRFKSKQLTLSPYEYERFDALNDYYIVEIKHRNTWYDRLLIEFDKYSYNSWYAHLNNKKFLYTVAHKQRIVVFNITRINKTNYTYNWEYRKMPKQTEFNKNNDIIKFVGYLDHNELKHTRSVYEFKSDKNLSIYI